MIVVASALSSLACFESDEIGWGISVGVESPVFELPAGDTSAGHFTVVTRNAPPHVTLLEFTAVAEYDGSAPITVAISRIPDAPPSPWSTGRLERDVFPDSETRFFSSQPSAERSCGQCIDGFSVVLERLSDLTEGTVTVDWQVAAWAGGEGEEPSDMEFEIVYDAFDLADGP